MDFARTLLEKYGWKEGEGLGKNKNGVAAPIQAKLKLNSYGVGYNAGKEFSNNWWERVFNEAASNIQPVQNQDGSVSQIETKGEINISTRKKRKGDKKLTYGSFKKKSCLVGNNVEPLKEALELSSSSSEDEDDNSLNNERLLEICGGRTGHKGARHGLTQSGKLARLEAQEKNSLATSKPQEPKSPSFEKLEKSGVFDESSEMNEDVKKSKKSKKKKKKKHDVDSS